MLILIESVKLDVLTASRTHNTHNTLPHRYITSMYCHGCKELLTHYNFFFFFACVLSLTLTCEINAVCRIHRMKSFYESHRSSSQFIIQVRGAAARTQCSQAVKCTNVLHSCCTESTMQAPQTLRPSSDSAVFSFKVSTFTD